MNEYFGIRYEFEHPEVLRLIENALSEDRKGFVCVVDGVVLTHSVKEPAFRSILQTALFNVCDSSWVPVYLRLIYRKRMKQYSGSELFEDIIRQRKYKMTFLGASDSLLQALKSQLVGIDSRIKEMSFESLPFCSYDEFDFKEIADKVNLVSPDIIWVGLGAPKQEHFMNNLLPYIDRGVMIGVGAVFKFYSGIEDMKRAPRWMVNYKLEWLYRLISEPAKQSRRVAQILRFTPQLILKECKNRKPC
ncbi:WecB/TagA/CpsF family glycosyltransferase [Parabacteroides sp. FAFU027]|uniref:WecB/TagA/CpsF family glycosyltransferase n=1 Tax=Parabacteroides sp. FAFU027 TaxID=2922715 RepID=UPI001FAEF2FE|nr:WecB/TagA/CpsF family glycosyltransferase [Parabacteroides sp. FAFU027]